MSNHVIFEKIRRLIKEKTPCPELIPLLKKHKCLYLQTLAGDKEALVDIQLAKAAIAARFQTCAPVFAKLRPIPYAVMKGAVLSQDAYGAPFLRKSGDIDLLTSREQVDRIKGVLLEQGFIQGRVTEEGIIPFSRRELLFQTAMSHQTAPFVKKISNPLCPYVNVDVNLDILWGESNQDTDMGYVLAHTIETKIAGAAAKRLTPEMSFLSLCLHHYKDMNSLYLLYEGGLGLHLFCDIYFSFRNLSLDVDLLREQSEFLSVAPYLYYCLFYTNEVFADPDLEALLKSWEAYRDDRLLDSFGLTDTERKKWPVPFVERLFAEDIRPLMDGLLDDKDREKIALNERLM